MRCARPSTTAVLPTPGSPMRTDYFSSAWQEFASRGEFHRRGRSRDRVPAPRQLDQVAAVLFEGAECSFRILRSHAVAAANSCKRLQNCFARRAMLGQQFGRFIFADCGNREQDVLGGNVLVLELFGFDKRTLQNFVDAGLNCCCATPVTFGRRAKPASISAS